MSWNSDIIELLTSGKDTDVEPTLLNNASCF